MLYPHWQPSGTTSITISAVVSDGSNPVRTLHSVPLTRQAKSGMELAVPPLAPVEQKPQPQQVSGGFSLGFGVPVGAPMPRDTSESGVVVQELPEVTEFTAEAWIRLADGAIPSQYCVLIRREHDFAAALPVV